MIIISHIPKTGGTSFLLYLQEVFGRRLYRDVVFRPRTHVGLRRLMRRIFGYRPKVPAGTQCIFGHFPANAYDRLYPSSRKGIWFRDPAERIVSSYHHLLRRNRGNLKRRQLIVDNNLSIEEYASLPDMINRQSFFLGGKHIQDFDFIGITEYHGLSLRLFARIFGLPEPRPGEYLSNCNPRRRGPGYELPPSSRRYLRKLNQKDYHHYEQALERFTLLCSQYGIAIPQPKGMAC